MSFKIIGHEGMTIGKKTKRRQVIFNEDLIFMLFIFKFQVRKTRQKEDQNGGNFIQKGVFYGKIWKF